MCIDFDNVNIPESVNGEPSLRQRRLNVDIEDVYYTLHTWISNTNPERMSIRSSQIPHRVLILCII
jgi:hypothetical protein